MRRKTLIVIASVGAFLVAALLFARAWIVRDDTSPVDVAQVVEQYRGETSAAATTPAPTRTDVPEAGVYEYATKGFEEADLLGGSRHDYPDRTTIAIVATECGFDQTWTALDKRRESWNLCRERDGLRPTRFADVHSFYGRTDDRSYECSGGQWPLDAGGPAATITCTREGVSRTDRVRAVGAEGLEVDGRKVATIHLRVRTRMQGTTDGSATFDWWLDRATGLPVRVTADVSNKSDTPIGTRAGYTERYELNLVSLEPRR
jgi:hypothetical protein